jgi:1-acyl-sn-glycerol-3-phosphate acyltransferase
LSYFDVLNLTHFLFKNGRAPRYLGKVGVFKVPIIGRILLAAGQVPVERETPNAGKAVDHAKNFLRLDIYLASIPKERSLEI